MDFHSLTRRELQTLCKKNKIPANITNVAMADALKSLESVEGVEEILQPCESEAIQSSVESPVRLEATSLYIPPTGGRSTRRRNVAKKDPETLKSMTRTRHTTQKTLTEDADKLQIDASGTLTIVGRTNRKKAAETSALKKMDSNQLTESVPGENKDLLTTPAQLGVASRRIRAVKEESVTQRVYSTRRSVRLAEKNMGAVKNLSENDMFAEDCENVKVNLMEGFDDLEQMSGITGAEFEVFEENSQNENESEASSQELVAFECKQIQLECPVEEELHYHSETDVSFAEVNPNISLGAQESEFDWKSIPDSGSNNCNGTEVPKDECMAISFMESNEPHDTDVTYDLLVSESKFAVANRTGENADKYDSAGCGEKSVLEMECEILIENHTLNDKNSDSEDAIISVVNEDSGEMNTELLVTEIQKELNPDLANELVAYEELTNMPCDDVLMKAIDEVTEEADGINIVQPEDEDIEGMIVPCEAVEVVENSPMKQVVVGIQGKKGFPSHSAALYLNIDLNKEESARLVGRTPDTDSASKASAAKIRMQQQHLVVSTDNKENIDTKETTVHMVVKKKKNAAAEIVVPKLDDLSIRKLTKMLKEKLQITNNNSSETENINMDQVPMRPALKALP